MKNRMVSIRFREFCGVRVSVCTSHHLIHLHRLYSEIIRSIAGAISNQMHTAYKAGVADRINFIKEFRLPSRRRIDFLDIPNGEIFELKPFNLNGMRQGSMQLDEYRQELQDMPRLMG